MAIHLSASEREMIDRLGQVAESSSMTRVTGRIWALLVISEEPLAPAEIAEALHISRASVSAAIKVLEGVDLLEVRSKPGDRQSYYAMREQPYRAMLQLHIKRASAHLEIVRSTLQSIERPGARKGLMELEALYSVSLTGFAAMLAELEGKSS